jgi:3-oxoadipate enol-lactonase
MEWNKACKFLGAVLALTLWTLSGARVQASLPLYYQEKEAVETLVQVGKYRLNFQVIEGGSLTILLEAGGGMDSREWNRIAPELAHKTGATIVSYDRAGFGKSDLPETPHDMREEVDWLWQGLQKLGLDKELILVGHSFGGWMIRLFSSEHPDVVRGMVFVDPFTNEIVDLLGVEYLDNQPLLGKIPFDTSHPEKFTKFQRAVVRMVGDGLAPKMEIMRKTSVPSDIPVVVITSGRPFLPKIEEQEAWRKSQEQFTASIKRATLIIAEKSGHMIPGTQPDLIIEAVMDVIGRSSSFAQNYSSGYIDIGKDKIFHEMAGKGPTLIFIHDGLVHRETWDYQFSFFSNEYRVIRYDRRGYGNSSAATEAYSVVEDLNRLFTHLEIEKACLIAMSSGGRLTIDFTLQYPDKVSSLILVGAVVGGFPYTQHFYNRGGHLPADLKTMEERRLYYARNDPYEIFEENKAAKEKVARLVTDSPAKGHSSNSSVPQGEPSYQRLNEIKIPALILVGEFDIPDVHAHAGAINAGIVNSKRDIIPKSGHLIPLEQPDLFNDAVEKFLNALPKR